MPSSRLRRELDGWGFLENISKKRSNAQAQCKPAEKEKKSRAASPALKIVSTLFPRKFGFDLD
jgi:hypothetical protein